MKTLRILMMFLVFVFFSASTVMLSGCYSSDSETAEDDDGGTTSGGSSTTTTPSTSYTFELCNGTEGNLKNVYIGSSYYGDMSYINCFYKTYSSRPSSISWSAQSDGLDSSTFSSTYYTSSGTYSGGDSIDLPSNYFSLWIRNNSGITLSWFYFNSTTSGTGINHTGGDAWYGFFPKLGSSQYILLRDLDANNHWDCYGSAITIYSYNGSSYYKLLQVNSLNSGSGP
ncbi:MAG TPA: hypothetical protein PK253_13285 [Spirochaetota bacterium]|nr:hypothetical protein [Spirochaetota bacterium]